MSSRTDLGGLHATYLGEILMAGRLSAMISSTVRDLPEHRRQVGEACLRQGVFPVMMEHLPASDADAVAASLRMVEEADVYLGVYGHRYGYIPRDHRLSITEMEYDRAARTNKPRLVFLMHDDHPIRAADVEKGEAATHLEAFKERLRADRVVAFFRSPEELRAQVVEGLSHFRPRDLTAFHRESIIPRPPEPYVAHPYTLLQTAALVGRRAELEALDDWVRDPSSPPLYCLSAIGGMGKSALTWAWFQERAARVMTPLAGRLWWSFYESDASFENFVLSALAYVSGRDRDDLRDLALTERESRLLAALDREPFLLVLDGMERLLLAYARMDAGRLADEDLDRHTANAVAGASGGATPHQLRKTTDPRAGAFLRKLTRSSRARVLVSTRLFPADLQAVTGHPLPGCRASLLSGLTDEDAVRLWSAFGARGQRESLLETFRRFDNYPLLVRALAGEVARHRRAPGDFDRWRQDHPDFDPASLPLVQVKSQVLAFALGGLGQVARKVLYTVGAFRMPATYDTLAALLVGEKRLFPRDQQLDAALTELEDRGLLGWDRAANRYDLHPVVRAVAWQGLADREREGVYEARLGHFEAVPVPDERDVRGVEDLTAPIELYNTLVGLGRFADAFTLFNDRLYHLLYFRLGAMRQLGELLEMLFPAGVDREPALDRGNQMWALMGLGHARLGTGRPEQAAQLYRRAGQLSAELGKRRREAFASVMQSIALRHTGQLRPSEAAARRAVLLSRAEGDRWEEVGSLCQAALTLATRGSVDAERALRLVSALRRRYNLADEMEGLGCAVSAQAALWEGRFEQADESAGWVWWVANAGKVERDAVRALRLQSEAALGLGEYERAEAGLQEVLTRARAVEYVEQELAARTALAELRRRQGDLTAAHELLEGTWEPVERGPYCLLHIDALNALARIKRDAGDLPSALDAAMRAYRLAWCDGPPFAYHWGLEAARTVLAGLGAAEPHDLLPHKESSHEALPDLDLNAPDGS